MNRFGTLLITLAIFFSLIVVAPPAFADPPEHKGNPDKQHREKNKDDTEIVDAALLATSLITRGEARELAVNNNATGCKPIPPGIQKNMARGKPMPPGIQRTRLPDSLESELPHQSGYQWNKAGCDLVLVHESTAIVTDILLSVFD